MEQDHKPVMSTLAYIMMQDRLSTGGSFILCDGNATGFPISYASAGFCDLFGYPAVECKGVKCGDLVAAKSIIDNDSALKNTSSLAGVSTESVRVGLDLMTAYTGKECKEIINDDGKVSFSVVLNRRKDGELFVNELVMMMHRYPSLGWSYFVGFQRDISNEISVSQLMHAAQSAEDYLSLIRERDAHVAAHVARLGAQREDAVQYLNEKASEAWVDKFLMTQVLLNDSAEEEEELHFAKLPDSLCSTGPGGDSESSANSESEVGRPAAKPIKDSLGAVDTTKGIVGLWHGCVSKELGGHDQALEFLESGSNMRITMFGKTIDGTYELNCSEEPYQLTLMLPVPSKGDAAGPKVHPVACIVKLQDGMLHFCQAHTSPERPKSFEGPGYCLMRREKAMSDASTDLPKSSVTVRSGGMSSKSSYTASERPTRKFCSASSPTGAENECSVRRGRGRHYFFPGGESLTDDELGMTALVGFGAVAAAGLGLLWLTRRR